MIAHEFGKFLKAKIEREQLPALQHSTGVAPATLANDALNVATESLTVDGRKAVRPKPDRLDVSGPIDQMQDRIAGTAPGPRERRIAVHRVGEPGVKKLRRVRVVEPRNEGVEFEREPQNVRDRFDAGADFRAPDE